MKNYTNIHTEERMYIMSEKELKQERVKAVKRYKELKKRRMKRFFRWLFIGILKVTAVSIAWLAVITMFICSIPPR